MSVASILTKSPLVVFVSSGCPYCDMAEEALDKARIPVRIRRTHHLLFAITHSHLTHASPTLCSHPQHSTPTLPRSISFAPPYTGCVLQRSTVLSQTHARFAAIRSFPLVSLPSTHAYHRICPTLSAHRSLHDSFSRPHRVPVQTSRGVAKAAQRAEEQDRQDERPELLGQQRVCGRL